jgi:DNA-binding transcriptional MerR regulator
MRIGELSRRTGISVRSLRYYEQKNLIQSKRLENGYREFDEIAVERVKAIQLYFGLGLNTDQIEKILNCGVRHTLPHKNPVCEGILSLYERKLAETNDQIRALLELKAKLEERISMIKGSSLHVLDLDQNNLSRGLLDKTAVASAMQTPD